ncbi:MAG: 5'/3'-nucleotidase SurE [Rickettsiales bacterium]|nr:5'/3'-nucleotidase SurE [Rickettsiales bacterium]|tara:strand:+ start:3801 stop:4562 length:762 start_codon:yes stop_codon:yes gene_type:complete
MTAPLILVTNDDGLDAPGIAALADAAAPLGEVWVVAPATEQSAMSHALTLHRPLRLSQHGERRYAVSGTPTDSVFFGVLNLLPRKPDLLLSGINRGPNLGEDVSYSGTVSAALEAAVMGIPALAFSHVKPEQDSDYLDGAELARQLAGRVLEHGLPAGNYLNVNFPAVPRGEIRGVRVCRLGKRYYEDSIVECRDPRGRPYFWIGGSAYRFDEIPGTDCVAVHDGYASITALHTDPTDLAACDMLRGWGLEDV